MFQIIKDIIYIILILNIIGAVYTVFRQRRDIAATWAWLLVLFFLPGVGFVIYAFVGRKLPENKLFPLKSKTRLQLDQVMEHQRRELKKNEFTAA
ncbi:MAG: PLD nuclease N-terminal domain-containing protein [Pediococcus pentosaceus]|nr:PLD nuclease N-terminal domain-containing protein [Pediococcus pentosaceus]